MKIFNIDIKVNHLHEKHCTLLRLIMRGADLKPQITIHIASDMDFLIRQFSFQIVSATYIKVKYLCV